MMYDAVPHINTERITALIEPKGVPLPRRLYSDRLGWNRRSKSETLGSSTQLLAKLVLGKYRSNQSVPELQQQLIEQNLPCLSSMCLSATQHTVYRHSLRHNKH
ncbi:hypothetical protein VFPPC_17830 [Pochonia chlamydosporia 170]|uniref:Uncharacterized protein n=1 Tax=Pochonia chlamydosporia 170 TaxID=1380566 RepID=A0A219AQB0_METCM|nr:hypothetical protein VFPPC_17830 [Pochonia chlamydosporia 170]OWT42977.1 hypothetical protein VFPPC_17830 [Pochonia chlamydosporia 170]